MELYRKTQIGTLIIFAFLIALLLIFWAIPREQVTQRTIIGLVIIITLSLFYSLTIVVTDKFIRFYMGIGLIKKTIPLSEIILCKPTKTPILRGWGIKKIHSGWQFNVTGLKAVEIHLQNGKQYVIGADDPDKICEIINEIKTSTQQKNLR